MEAVIRGLSSAVCGSFLAGCFCVPSLACSVASGSLISPASSSLRLRSLNRGSCWGVDLLLGSQDDLIVVLDVLLLGASSCVPALARNVALGLGGGRDGLRSRNTVGLGLLKLGQASVRSSRV